MTYEEWEQLASTLPNGFHDSAIRSLHVDYERRQASVDWLVDFSEYPNPTPELRNVRVVFSGLTYFIMEPPFPGSPYGHSTPLSVVDVDSSLHEKIMFNSVAAPASALKLSTYVSDWNSFIHIAAEKAELICPEQQ
jgi:hypothetical protein